MPLIFTNLEAEDLYKFKASLVYMTSSIQDSQAYIEKPCLFKKIKNLAVMMIDLRIKQVNINGA